MRDTKTMYETHGFLITFLVVLALVPVWIVYFVYLLIREVARERMSQTERVMFREELRRRESQ